MYYFDLNICYGIILESIRFGFGKDVIKNVIFIIYISDKNEFEIYL